MSQLNREELIAQGWERRFTTDSKRVTEYLDQYRQLGLDVIAIQASPDELDGVCGTEYYEEIKKLYRTIYTKPSDDETPEDDLW